MPTATPPCLRDLPPAPAGRTGWPWTEGPRGLPTTTLDGAKWPKVSVVTPSFNQGQFLEETIRSVLLQGYPDLEYIVIDDGSTDDSVEIIKRYEPWLAYWVHQENRGQSAAINEGFRRATGEIVAWLNSDDTYEPGAVMEAVRVLDHDAGRHIVNGGVALTDAENRPTREIRSSRYTLDRLQRHWIQYCTPPQPAIFWCRHILDEVGLLDESLRYVMDYDLWCRIARHYEFHQVNRRLARYRVHAESNTGKGWEPFRDERRRICRRYWGSKWKPKYWMFAFEEYRAFGKQDRSIAFERQAQAARNALCRDARKKFWIHLFAAALVSPSRVVRGYRGLMAEALLGRKWSKLLRRLFGKRRGCSDNASPSTNK